MSFDRYGWIEALLASDRTDGAKLVGVRLALKYADVGGAAWPGYATLADDLARSVPAVRRAVRDLRDGGFVTWSPGCGQGHSNRYQLVHNVLSSDPLQGDQQRTPSDREGDQQRNERWSPAFAKVISSDPRTIHEPSTEPSTSAADAATWPDGWSASHPKADRYSSVLHRLAHRLGDDWPIVKAEGPHVQKLRNAAARAAEADVDPYELARVVTAKPLDGLTSYAAGLARRIDDAIPTVRKLATENVA